MARDDWYRRTTWTRADAADFEQRLARSRSSRNQYLHIQALTLLDTGKRDLAPVAIELATRCVTEEPDGFSAQGAWRTIARARVLLGDVEGALEAYRAGIAVERLQPNIRCFVYLDFAWLVATRDRKECFEEAVQVLDAGMQDDDLLLPVHRLRFFGAIALISDGLGDADNARRMARNALEAVRVERGPFARHPTAGVVDDLEPAILRRLERLAR